MLNLQNAIKRYRVARLFGLPTKLCIKIFLFGKGNPLENFEKMTRPKEYNNEEC